jgi:hypothetical protein
MKSMKVPVDKPVDIHSLSLSFFEKKLKFFFKNCRLQVPGPCIRDSNRKICLACG